MQARLLGQLSFDGDQRILAVVIHESGWQLPQPPAHGMPVLRDEDDVGVLLVAPGRVQHDHGHRAIVFDHLPLGRVPTGHDHVVDPDPGDMAGEHRF